MAYKWDDKGFIVANGLPDGVKIDVNQYQSVMKQFNDSRQSSPSAMYDGNRKLSDSITKFVYRDGKVQGFVPELEKSRNFYAGNSDYVPVTDRNRTGPINSSAQEKGYYVDVSGIQFDQSLKSGDMPNGSEVIFSKEGGAPLAEFQSNGKTMGYMRLATQQAQEADNVQLGNNSGTTTQQRRRRTLL